MLSVSTKYSRSKSFKINDHFFTYFTYFLALNELSKSFSIFTLNFGLRLSIHFLRSASVNVRRSSGSWNGVRVRSLLLWRGHGSELWEYLDDLARFVVSNVVSWAVWVNNNHWIFAEVVSSTHSRDRSCVRWDLAALLNESRHMLIYFHKKCRTRHFCTSSLGNSKLTCNNLKLETDRTRRQWNDKELNVGRFLIRRNCLKTFCAVGFTVHWTRNKRWNCFSVCFIEYVNTYNWLNEQIHSQKTDIDTCVIIILVSFGAPKY